MTKSKRGKGNQATLPEIEASPETKVTSSRRMSSADARALAKERAEAVATAEPEEEDETISPEAWRSALFADAERLEALYQDNEDFADMLDAIRNDEAEERRKALADEEALKKRFKRLGLPYGGSITQSKRKVSVRKTNSGAKARPAEQIDDAELLKWFSTWSSKLSTDKLKKTSELPAAAQGKTPQDLRFRNAARDRGWIIPVRGPHGGIKLGPKAP